MEGKADIKTDYKTGIYNGSCKKVIFKTVCPVYGCKNSNKIISWKCSYSGHDLYIYEDGILSCDNPKGLYGKITDWIFNCGEHNFKYPSYQALIHSLSNLLSLDACDEDFIDNCLIALFKMKKEFK